MVKLIPESKYKTILKNPEKFGIDLKLTKSEKKIHEFSREEISHFFFGVYKWSKLLKVDENYFIKINRDDKIICELEKVTLTNENKSLSIDNISRFYVTDYLLITAEEFNGKNKHNISNFLMKIGMINKGKLENENLFSIRNDYQLFQRCNGKKVPKDLFHPIKKGINDTFFSDDYAITDFELNTKIKFE